MIKKIMNKIYQIALKFWFRWSSLIPLHFGNIKNIYFYEKNNREDTHYDYRKKNDIKISYDTTEYKIIWKKYDDLICGLDEKSIKTINNVIIRLYKLAVSPYADYDDLFWKDNIQKVKKSFKEKNKYKNVYKLPKDNYEDSVFEYKCWLIPEINHNLWGKSIIDCGAYIGDSAIMFFHEIKWIDKLYAFEPMTENIELLNQTIEMNKLHGKIIPVQKWVGDKTEKMTITKIHSGSSIVNDRNLENKEEIEITTIDDFVDENNINVWLIKRDIEWYELESIKWAEQTIKKYKPILLISIYHTGKDFFEIKPILENWDLWYKFKVLHTSYLHPYAETMLVAY